MFVCEFVLFAFCFVLLGCYNIHLSYCTLKMLVIQIPVQMVAHVACQIVVDMTVNVLLAGLVADVKPVSYNKQIT